MSVTIHLVGQLKSIFNNQSIINVDAGQTVRDILVSAQVMPEMVAGVVVNGDLQSKDYILQDQDDVKLIAVMSGG
jgi:sulfur carrier protein ThiS